MSNTIIINDLVWLASDPFGRLMLDTELGMMLYISDCCGAAAKGGQDGVVCRNCYQPIPDEQARAWMVTDDLAWRNYGERLLPDLEHFAQKAAARVRQSALELMA